MDFEIFISISLYHILKEDFLSQEKRWSDFIKSKDLGIVCNFNATNNTGLYKITDQKKWALTKIKYGL